MTVHKPFRPTPLVTHSPSTRGVVLEVSRTMYCMSRQVKLGLDKEVQVNTQTWTTLCVIFQS